jgi:hypothetical protein
MNKDQLARLQRHRKVQQVLADNAPAVAAVPAFAKLVANYLVQLELLDGVVQRNAITSETAMLAKTATSTALIARLVKAANALYLLYKAEKPANLAEAAKLHRRASDYTNMSDQALAAEAADLSQQVATHQAKLKKDYNWDATTIAALAVDAHSFDVQLTAPQQAFDATKTKSATAKSTLKTLNDFLRDDLRAGMELLQDTHPGAYQALREASQTDDERWQKRNAKQIARLISQNFSLVGNKITPSLASNAGITTVFVNATGAPLWLELTVKTLCTWTFLFPPAVPEGQPPRLDATRVRPFSDSPASLIGTSSSWKLLLDNLDNAAQPFEGSIRLIQGVSADGGQELYVYPIAKQSVPAAPAKSPFLFATLTFVAA